MEFLQIVQSWDTAYKDKDINDPSVCTTWGQTRQGYYLLDVYRDRLIYPDVRRMVVNQALKWRANAVLIEDKASGQSLIQELRAGTTIPEDLAAQYPDQVEAGQLYTPIIVAIDTEGQSKTDRLLEVSPIFEAGMVWLPEYAPWLVDYESELFGFPLATNDDQVDSTSQFLKWAHKRVVQVGHHRAGHRRAAAEGDIYNSDDDLSLGVKPTSYGDFM